MEAKLVLARPENHTWVYFVMYNDGTVFVVRPTLLDTSDPGLDVPLLHHLIADDIKKIDDEAAKMLAMGFKKVYWSRLSKNVLERVGATSIDTEVPSEAHIVWNDAEAIALVAEDARPLVKLQETKEKLDEQVRKMDDIVAFLIRNNRFADAKALCEYAGFPFEEKVGKYMAL